MTDPAERELAVFSEARRLPVSQRAAFLNQACAGDAALRKRVEELLQAGEEAGDFLNQPAAAPAERIGAASPSRLPAEKPGDKIGRYKLLQQIGEGGCGVVYMAEQEEPVRRRVALKVIKLGMDTKSVIARFEAERQALALMDHPNIAKVLDAGATDNGRPYFVMELVRGIKITDFCDENKVPTQERLNLFIQVCQAIQHAHQKGIIHRDIKPSNILVTINDGVPMPKVIDFGIAKATQGRLTDQTLFTAFEQFIGTPAYMSPEQAVMTSLDIDTRSDIYSLGVLLYELLTSKTPFEQKELLAAGLDEMRRTIREKEPPKPSTRLSTMDADALTTTASHHHTEAPKLVHLIRGDLDWIVMKCLEKDRTRRYETANGLARDIERHLHHEPVNARPPSRLYELGKTVQRHKFGFAAGAALITVLVTATVVSTSEANRAVRAEKQQIGLRREAEAAKDKAQADEKKAQTEAAKSQQVAQFLQDMLQGVGPSVALGRDTTLLREILDKTAGRMSHDLKGQPEVEADLRSTIARVYFALGQFEKAEMMHREALKIRRKLFGNEHPLVAASLYDLSDALMRQYSHPEKLTEAETLLREALGLQRKLQGNENQDVARSLNSLAFLLVHDNKLAEAETMFREALAMRRKLLRNGHPDVAWSLQGLCEVLFVEGRPAEAEPLARESLLIRQIRYGKEHPDIAWSLFYLAKALDAQGKAAEAEPLYREALAMRRKLLGNEHPETIEAVQSLANVLKTENKPAEIEVPDARVLEAEKLFEEAINTGRLKLGETNLIVGKLLNDYAELLAQEGKWEPAAEYFLKSLPIMRRAQQDENLAWTLRTLGDALNQIGRNREAEAYLRESLALYRKTHQQDDTTTGWDIDKLGYALWQQHQLPEAEQAYRDALSIYTKLGRSDDGEYPYIVGMLRKLLAEENKPAEIEALYREVLVTERSALGNDSSAVAATLLDLAGFLESQNRPAEAAQTYRESMDIILKPPLNEHLFRLSSGVLPGLVEAGERQQVSNICRMALNSTATNAGWFNNASWYLATTENPTNRDPALAVELAERAVHINPQGDWNTVGVAYYRASDFKQALADLTRAARTAPDGGTSDDTFFLAMAEHQVGNADAAQRYYARAIQWMKEHDPNNPELLRFRTEAEQLLGLETNSVSGNQIQTPSAAK